MSLLKKFGVILVASILVAFDTNAEAARKPGDIVLEPAHLVTPQGETIHYEIGTLYVPENRNSSKSRLIGIGFARFRALAPTTVPPTFHLPGGPGASYLDFLKPDSPRFARMIKDLAFYRSVSDVIYVDQRGFSARGEVLKYASRPPESSLNQLDTLAQSTARSVGLARAATADAAAKGIDLRGYTVKECAADVNDLSQAFGYPRITLIGQSFGSQWSFAVMRLYPQRVARAVLSGVEPLNDGYDMPSHVLAAIQRQWWEAERDIRLQPWLPPGGLAAAAEAILQRLKRGSVSVSVSDPSTGKTVSLALGLEDFQRDFAALARPNLLLALYYEHYEQWARHTLDSRQIGNGELPLIGFLIDSSLGVTKQREYLLRTDSAAKFLGHWDFDAHLATADIWPSEDVGDEFRTPVINTTPVVFVNGDWDIATPIENVLDVAPYFINGRTLRVTHGLHNAYETARNESPQVAAVIVKFLKTGGTADLPAEVTVQAPQFAPPDFSPPIAQSVQSIAADHHLHLVSPEFAKISSYAPFTASDLIKLMDAAGIRRGLVLSAAYQFGNPNKPRVENEYAKVRAENDWTSQEIARFPNRLRGLCSFNPLKDYALKELERCAKDPQLHYGIKLHFGNSDVEYGNPNHVEQIKQVFRAANKHKMAIIVHMRPSVTKQRPYGAEQARVFLHNFLPAAPDVPVQIAHLSGAGGYEDSIDQALAVFADAIVKDDPLMAHVYFDVSGVAIGELGPDQAALIVQRIRQLGLGRILNGSDVIPGAWKGRGIDLSRGAWPDSPREAWEAFRKLPLTDAEFEAIESNMAPYIR